MEMKKDLIRIWLHLFNDYVNAHVQGLPEGKALPLATLVAKKQLPRFMCDRFRNPVFFTSDAETSGSFIFRRFSYLRFFNENFLFRFGLNDVRRYRRDISLFSNTDPEPVYQIKNRFSVLLRLDIDFFFHSAEAHQTGAHGIFDCFSCCFDSTHASAPLFLR